MKKFLTWRAVKSILIEIVNLPIISLSTGLLFVLIVFAGLVLLFLLFATIIGFVFYKVYSLFDLISMKLIDKKELIS